MNTKKKEENLLLNNRRKGTTINHNLKEKNVNAYGKNIIQLETTGNNRIAFYAENRSFTDYDVLFTVKGTNFRQSAAKPRWIRVPGASKVHLKTIVLMRDKKPLYTKALRVNDSLSRRALKKEFTVLDIPPPKIKPKKQITIYTSERCASCDSIINKLDAGNFIFRSVSLDEKPEIKEQLGKFLAKSTEEMDTISSHS